MEVQGTVNTLRNMHLSLHISMLSLSGKTLGSDSFGSNDHGDYPPLLISSCAFLTRDISYTPLIISSPGLYFSKSHDKGYFPERAENLGILFLQFKRNIDSEGQVCIAQCHELLKWDIKDLAPFLGKP